MFKKLDFVKNKILKPIYLSILHRVTGKNNYDGYSPKFVAVNITDNCCFRCVMCDQWKTITEKELLTEEWKDIFEQLGEEGVKSVSFAGGEPFMRRDMIELISYAQKFGMNVGVITNGYLLNEELVKKAIDAGANNFGISIDATGEVFDRIRGVKGAFDKVKASCEILSKYRSKGVRVYVYFTLMKPSLGIYRKVFSIAEEYGFLFVVNLFDYTPYFFTDMKDCKNDFWITKEDLPRLKEFQKFLIEKKTEDPDSVFHTYREIQYFREYFEDPVQKKIACSVSQLRIGIDSQGNVYGGCWSMGSFGNLKDKTLREIIRSERYKRLHGRMYKKNCPGCTCGYTTNLRRDLFSNLVELKYRLLPSFRRKIIE